MVKALGPIWTGASCSTDWVCKDNDRNRTEKTHRLFMNLSPDKYFFVLHSGIQMSLKTLPGQSTLVPLPSSVQLIGLGFLIRIQGKVAAASCSECLATFEGAAT